MDKADSLSRRVNWVKKLERDNKNQVILRKELLEIKVIKKGTVID